MQARRWLDSRHPARRLAVHSSAFALLTEDFGAFVLNVLEATVLWSEINAKSNLDIGAWVLVPLADVIDAIHDGAQVSAVFPACIGAMPDYTFEVIEFTNGLETIDLVRPSGAGPGGHLRDLDRLDY